jgi:hypothetical protein
MQRFTQKSTLPSIGADVVEPVAVAGNTCPLPIATEDALQAATSGGVATDSQLDIHLCFLDLQSLR